MAPKLFTGDAIRSAAVCLSAVAQTVVPIAGPLLTGRGEDTARYDTVITPPDYAFAIWAPIFAGTIGSAIQQARPGQAAQEFHHRTGWPLAAAYSLTTLWSVAAQSGRFGATPAILPAAAGCAAVAYRRIQRIPPAGDQRLTVTATGLLLGWTSLASVVNVLALTPYRGGKSDAPHQVRLACIGAGAAVSAVSATVLSSRRGYLPLAAAAGWGLLTTALTPTRPAAVRLTTAVGAAAVIASAAARLTSPRITPIATHGATPSSSAAVVTARTASTGTSVRPRCTKPETQPE